MEYIKEVNILEATVHILDNNGDDPVFNEYEIKLNDEIYTFLYKHIERILKDEELSFARFMESSVIKDTCYDFLNGNSEFMDTSKILANYLFEIMKEDINIIPCDLVVASISTEIGPMVAILKMDFVKNFIHNINYVDGKIEVNIIPQNIGLPVSSQKVQKAAFIKNKSMEDMGFDLYVMDKISKKDMKENGMDNGDYYTNKYLKCVKIKSSRDLTKGLFNTTEGWTRQNLINQAENAENVRSIMKNKLREEDEIKLLELAMEMFNGDEDKIRDYMENAYNNGLEDNIKVDKAWVEKKLKRTRLKIDKHIDLYINEEAYNDVNKFEMRPNGDGTINILIKNVINFIEK